MLAASLAVLAMPAGAQGSTRTAAHPAMRAYDKQLLADVNRARVQNGLKPYTESDALYRMAHAWAEHMAKAHSLEHNPNAAFGTKQMKRTCPHATTAGENVGEQGTTNSQQLFQLYMDEPYHRANILSPKYTKGPAYTDVGIATVAVPNGDGTSSEWNVMDFANHCG
jgi:uncharacterized protein YkwD